MGSSSAVQETTVAKISLADQSALEWFFGPGEAEFRRSTFGAMIEAVESDVYSTRRCKRCRGIGFTDEDVARATQELQRVLRDRPDSLDVEAWADWQERLDRIRPRCRECEGEGFTRRRRRDQDVPRTGYRRCRACRRGVDPQCKGCGGSGFQVVAAAFMTRGRGGGGGHEPSSWALERYAIVSRRLDAVPRRFVEVLARYYGDEGQRWAPTRHGRILAIYGLTGAGKSLLEESKNALDLGATERLANQLVLDGQNPKPHRRTLLRRADQEARALYQGAVEAWNLTPRRRRMAA